ncbi:MAG: hypothetical protein AAF420_09625 [Pseudomonadota bacterium]
MANFLFVYHDGRMPETPEEGQQVMAQWQAWLGGMGDSVVDMGAPLGLSVTVHPDGSVTDDGGANPASGYSVVKAESKEAAIGMAKGCPIKDAGGTVEVAECMEM